MQNIYRVIAIDKNKKYLQNLLSELNQVPNKPEKPNTKSNHTHRTIALAYRYKYEAGRVPYLTKKQALKEFTESTVQEFYKVGILAKKQKVKVDSEYIDLAIELLESENEDAAVKIAEKEKQNL